MGRNGFEFGIGTDLVISYSYLYPTFDDREKLEPELIPDQLEYYPSKSRGIQTDTYEYGFSCHVYSLDVQVIVTKST